MTRKNNIHNIREQFVKFNCVLHTEEEDYKNNKSKLSFTCNKHKEEIQTRAWINIKTSINTVNNICSFCAKEDKFNKQKASIKDIETVFHKHNAILIDVTSYRNAKAKLPFRCNKHMDTIQYISYDAAKYYNNICSQCQTDSISGENAVFWNGGVSSKNKVQRNSTEYKKWRLDIFERDEYKCQCCNKLGGKLNSHHINNFSSNESVRFDTENGITLCENCHMPNKTGSFHNIYGSYNNNIFQLQEYFDDIRYHLKLPLVKIEDIIYQ